MKKRTRLGLVAAASTVALILGGSIPASAAFGETGTTHCSGSTPAPWLKATATNVGGASVTPPGRGYSTFVVLGTTPYYSAGTAPGGGWSVWTQYYAGLYADINTAQTYGYCTPL